MGLRKSISEKHTWKVLEIGGGAGVDQHADFHGFGEIGHIFHDKYIFNNKHTFQVEIWPISCLNDSETQERGL